MLCPVHRQTYAAGQMVKLSFTLEEGLMDLINSFSKKQKSCFQTVTEFAVMDSWMIEGSTGCYWLLNYLAVSAATHGMPQQ